MCSHLPTTARSEHPKGAPVQAAATKTDIQVWRIENLGGSNYRVSNVANPGLEPGAYIIRIRDRSGRTTKPFAVF